MKLILTESLEQAEELAGIPPGRKSHGYIDAPGCCYVWIESPLTELALPDAYGWKEWRLEDLPLLPSPFQFQCRPFAPQQKQLALLQSLLTKSDLDEVQVTPASSAAVELDRYRLMGILGLPRPGIKMSWLTESPRQWGDLSKAAKTLARREEAEWILRHSCTRAITLRKRLQEEQFGVIALSRSRLEMLEHGRLQGIAPFSPELCARLDPQEVKNWLKQKVLIEDAGRIQLSRTGQAMLKILPAAFWDAFAEWRRCWDSLASDPDSFGEQLLTLTSQMTAFDPTTTGNTAPPLPCPNCHEGVIRNLPKFYACSRCRLIIDKSLPPLAIRELLQHGCTVGKYPYFSKNRHLMRGRLVIKDGLVVCEFSPTSIG